MAVTRTAPWWLGWLLAGSLLSIFMGERILEGAGAMRYVFSAGGALGVVLSAAWRARSWRAATGGARRVEGLLLLAYSGCVLALLGYALSSEDGMRRLGIDFVDQEARARYRALVQVLWITALAVSLLPALGAQIALGAHRHARGEAARVEGFRVIEAATGGLVVALTGAFLFVVGYIVSERNKALDLSYFKTSSPGAATQAIVSSVTEPLRLLLFFPDVSPVKDEVVRYFSMLEDATGRELIEEYDRLASPRLAEEHNVADDGTILFVRGDRSERLILGTSMEGARPTLRALDREVQQKLLTLLRGRRLAYLTTGHGELNDPESAGPFVGTPLGQVDALQDILQFQNYEVLDLGIGSGLGNDVPDDAAFVMVLGPRRPFLEEEMFALERYLARGGSLLLALDPESAFRMGPLERRLGVRYVSVPLADDEQHLRQNDDLSDRRFIITDRFSSHEAVTTLARAGPGAGILFVGPGHLELAEDTAAKPLFVVRSMASTFADLNGDYQLDEGTEIRESYNLVAAVEGDVSNAAPVLREAANTNAQGDDAAADRGMRALVYTSSSVVSDGVLVSLGLNAALVADGLKWLGREETFAGPAVSEEDVPIVHTQAEDVAWFYATILGAPGLLLGGGLFGVYRRRHRRRTEA